MAKSQQSFSKKEKEKKKASKKRDKAEKMAERKANTIKGKSLEDMMAYVDENGNISDTPPDPSKKSTVNQEDILIGVARREDAAPGTPRTGTITNFNDAKGFGFIREKTSGESVFVHISGLLDPVREGDTVTFETEKTAKGYSAIRVQKA